MLTWWNVLDPHIRAWLRCGVHSAWRIRSSAPRWSARCMALIKARPGVHRQAATDCGAKHHCAAPHPIRWPVKLSAKDPSLCCWCNAPRNGGRMTIIRGRPSWCAEISGEDQARAQRWMLMLHSPACNHRFHLEHFSLSRGVTEMDTTPPAHD